MLPGFTTVQLNQSAAHYVRYFCTFQIWPVNYFVQAIGNLASVYIFFSNLHWLVNLLSLYSEIFKLGLHWACHILQIVMMILWYSTYCILCYDFMNKFQVFFHAFMTKMVYIWILLSLLATEIFVSHFYTWNWPF